MSDQFALELCKKVIADTCGMLGFHAVKDSAAEVMADILRSYILQLGSTCVDVSNLSGRTEQNANDVEFALNSFENMSVKELQQYYLSLAVDEDEDPDSTSPKPVNLSSFEFDVPNFPRPKSSNLVSAGDQTIATRFARIDSTEQAAALLTKQKQAELEAFKPPPFLPPFPPQHTFSFTPVLSDKPKDAYSIQHMKTKQRRQIESSLTRIHNSELMDKIPDGLAFEEAWEYYHEQHAQQTSMTVLDHNTPENVIKGTNAHIDEDLVVNPYLIVMREKSSSATAPRPVQQVADVTQMNGETPNSDHPKFNALSLRRPVHVSKDLGKNSVKGDKEVITGVTGGDIQNLEEAPAGEPAKKKQRKA